MNCSNAYVEKRRRGGRKDKEQGGGIATFFFFFLFLIVHAVPAQRDLQAALEVVRRRKPAARRANAEKIKRLPRAGPRFHETRGIRENDYRAHHDLAASS